MNKYLKFTDETAMFDAMRSAGVLVEDMDGNEFVPAYHEGTAIDVVGLIVDTPAAMDEGGNVTNPATFVDGWHVNWRGPLPDALAEYEIEAPATPARVWA